jgi:flagellar motility protein MotE (MotC chaperone)
MNNYQDHFRKMKSNSHPVQKKKIKQQISKSRSKRRESSAKYIFMTVFIFCFAIYGFLFPESLMSLAERITLFSEGHASDKAVSAQPNDEKAAKTSQAPKSESKQKETAKEHSVPDNASYVQHLEERKSLLDQKEKDLKELEEKLQLEKLALEKKMQELDEKRREIASKLESRVKEDEENITKLVGVYSNMKPQSAALVMTTIEEDLAISILKRMKKQTAGEILNFLPPQKAKVLSEKYTGY